MPLSDNFQVDPNGPDDSDSSDIATDGFDIPEVNPRTVLGECIVVFLVPLSKLGSYTELDLQNNNHQ